MDLKDAWVLEYSPLQGSFNVEKIDNAILANIVQITGSRKFTGYVIIFTGTKDQCHSQGEALRNSGIHLIGRE